MKQAVQRKTLAGGWTAFTFNHNCAHFLVKNFSNGVVYVSFENNDDEAESIKIMSLMAEVVAVCFDGNNNPAFTVPTIYVKGSGEVEVEALDIYE